MTATLQVETLHWLKHQPSSSNAPSDFRLYVCTDGPGPVELCGLSLDAFPAVDEGAALSRAQSLPPQQQPALHRQSSDRRNDRKDTESLARLRSMGRVAAARAAGLDDAWREEPSAQWLGKADVPLQELSTRCWWTRLPAPSSMAGFADSALWAANPPGAPFVGQAHLKFKVRVAGSEVPKVFHVEVDSRAPCSRVVFVVVKSEQNIASLREALSQGRDIGAVAAEEAAQTYRALVGGIWRHFADSRLDDVDPFTACWEHGLLLGFMLRRGQALSERGRPIVSSAFRPGLAINTLRELLPSRWDIESRIQLWCFVGQIVAAVQELQSYSPSDADLTIRPEVWELYNLPRFQNRQHRQQLFQAWTTFCDVTKRQHTDFTMDKAKQDLVALIRAAPHSIDEKLLSQTSTSHLSELRQLALKAGVDAALVKQALSPANFSTLNLPAGEVELHTMSKFVAAGLRAMYKADCASTSPTFGWIRAVPLLCDFRIIHNAGAVATMTGHGFELPELEPLKPLSVEAGGFDADSRSTAAFANAGHMLARSTSVLADEVSFDQALERAYNLAAECEGARDRHQPTFEKLRAKLASHKDPESKQILDFVNDTERVFEDVVAHGREIGSFLKDFDARTLQLRTQRLKLIRKVGAGFSKNSREPRVSTLAGSGMGGHTDGVVMEMCVFQPEGIVSLDDGSVVFTDHSHCLRRICPEYEHGSTLAGMRGSGNRNGPLDGAAFSTPKGICIAGGDLIIADSANHCIRKIALSGDRTVTTLAGSSSRQSGYKNGIGTEALFNSPVDVAVRPNGVLVVCDRLNYCLRGIRPDGQTAVLAGFPQKKGTSDGKATPKKGTRDGKSPHALLAGPRGVAVLSGGSVIFTDGEGVRLLANGEVTTIAGQVATAGCSDGVGPSALFRTPTGLVERVPGIVLIADRGNNRICELDLGTMAVITVAGTGESGHRDAAAPLAQFGGPTHLCMLPDRTVAVSDSLGHRIRRLISPDSDDSAQVKYDAVTHQLMAATDELRAQMAAWETPLTAAKRQVAECAARIRHWNQQLLSSSFQIEAERAAVACRNQSASEEELYGFVLAAPSLCDLCSLVTIDRIPRLAAASISEALKIRLDKHTNWDQLSAYQGATELSALSQMLHSNPNIVGCSIIARAFGSRSFHLRFPQPCPNTLRLLEASVRIIHISTEDEVSDLERAVRAWLRESLTPRLRVDVPDPRNAGKVISENRSAEDVVLELFSRWTDTIQKWLQNDFFNMAPVACEWVVATHVSGLCADTSRGFAVLHLLPVLVGIVQDDSVLTDTLRNILTNVVEVNRPADVVQKLDTSLRTSGGTACTPPVHFRMLVPVLLRTLERVLPLPKATTDKERQEFRELGDARRRKQTSLPQLISSFEEATMVEIMPHISIWSPIVRWSVDNARWFGASDIGDATRQSMTSILTVARAHFNAGFAQLEAGLLTVNVTKMILQGAETHLVPVFAALPGLADPELLVTGLQEEISSAFIEIDQVNMIATKLLPGSPEHVAVTRLKSIFGNLTVQQMRWFLGRADTAGDHLFFAKLWNPPMAADPPVPIAAVLVDCIDWILHQDLLESDLFESVWQLGLDSRSSDSILAAAEKLQQIADSIDDKTITFGELRWLAPILDTHSLARLSSARGGVVSTAAWQVVQADPSWVLKTTATLSDWQHLYSICYNAKSIKDILGMIKVFGTRKCRSSLEIVHGSVALLEQSALPAFDNRQLHELPEFVTVASTIHRSLPAMNAQLVSLITESLDLIDWLRTEFMDDRDFTSAIEIAVGRSEMECPVELWEDGRVAEEKLSQLASVRSFLHPLAFRLEDTFESIDELLKCVSAIELYRTDATIVSMIEETNALLIPLTELLSDQSDSSALNRLVQMMLPDRCATWVFKGGLLDGQTASSDLALTFDIPRVAQSFVKTLKLPEILDWQSQVVLGSRGNQIAADSQEIIASFVASLDAAKELQDLLLELRVAGHFDFQEQWEFQQAVADVDAVRSEVSRLKQELKLWVTNTHMVRDTYYFLNFFSMRQIFLMSQFLLGNAHDGLREDLLQLLQATITQNAGDFEQAEQMLALIQAHFSASRGDSPSAVLTACGAALNDACKLHPVRVRTTEAAQSRDLAKDLKPGLSVLCSSHVLKHTLSAFACVGRLPERESLVFCQETSVETLTNLVLRWSSAVEHARCPLYCIVQPDLLPLREQTQLAANIRDAVATQRSKCASLLLVCSNDKSYIVSQFEAQMVTAVPLPAEELQHVGRDISGGSESLGGVFVVHSFTPGAGKSFCIRKQCSDTCHSRVHIPVNGVLSSAQLLTRIEQQIATLNACGSRTMLHLDLSSSVRAQFDFVLFELTVLGSLLDSASGRAYAWHPARTSIAVEVASGPLRQKLQTCSFLNLREVTVGPEFFVTDRQTLSVGMDQEFANTQFDGCVTSPDQVGEDAHGRLMYVVKTLQLLKDMGGSFPPIFVADEVAVCDSATSYSLLISSSKMSDQPSLWCLWSFVNVMYWQLREMSDPEGPIRGAVMPDANAEKPEVDLAIKQQIMGQLIAFAQSTATEFATRQTNGAGPDHVIGMNLAGMHKYDFNGRWDRMPYLNDGESVYQKTTGNGDVLFIYFRRLRNEGVGGWVIDDVIAPHGSVYSSTKDDNITSCWLSTPAFTADRSFRVQPAKDPRGHKGDAVVISGSREADENGIYIRQPPFDDIDGQPHYICHTPGSSKRKHLFFDKSGSIWVLCPQCNQDEGTDAFSQTKDKFGMWLTMPPMIHERDVQVAWVYSSGQVVDAKRRETAPKTGLQLEPEPEPQAAPNDDGFLSAHALKAWGDSNHEAMLFSNKTHTVTFLSQDPKKMKDGMHPNLVRHLEINRISVGEALNSLNGRFTEILSALTNVDRSEHEISKLLPDYQLTGDALLKMLAIYCRIRCGIPVILMGECGCGKTYLISFLCAWLGSPLENLDVHGGTTEDDIVQTFDKAIAHLQSGDCHEVFVFLDEVNTCAHMGIITEAICSRSLNGRKLPVGVKVLAAVNPHRRRSIQDDSAGLVFNLGADHEVDPMASLVYRVHPVPLTLEGFVFDFGALTPQQENLYIHGMVKREVAKVSAADQEAITILIAAAQAFCRHTVGDPSAVSLRDVKRCLRLLNWFMTLPPLLLGISAGQKASQLTSADVPSQNTKRKEDLLTRRPLAVAAILAMAHVYWYRHGKAEHRTELWDNLGWTLSQQIGRGIKKTCFASLIVAGQDSSPIPFVQTVVKAQERFCSQIQVEHGIAMNDALSENLFVVIVCILNRIPVFLVGKPGSSKTLTLQIIANNLNGEQSQNKFWRRFPSIHIIQFQCSPLSTAAAITTQFQMACSFQANAENTICVLLLDEVGLAEHSPDMPLKALHAILVDPPVAVVVSSLLCVCLLPVLFSLL